MARSTYIYLVITEDGQLAWNAFTVKKEMVGWLRRNPGNYKMYRMHDGGGGTVDITEETEELL